MRVLCDCSLSAFVTCYTVFEAFQYLFKKFLELAALYMKVGGLRRRNVWVLGSEICKLGRNSTLIEVG